MRNEGKTIDNVWVLDDQDRLLSRGGLCFRYSMILRAYDARFGWGPIAWEKQLPNGDFAPETNPETVEQLNSALRVRLARLEDETSGE